MKRALRALHIAGCVLFVLVIYLYVSIQTQKFSYTTTSYSVLYSPFLLAGRLLAAVILCFFERPAFQWAAVGAATAAGLLYLAVEIPAEPPVFSFVPRMELFPINLLSRTSFTFTAITMYKDSPA